MMAKARRVHSVRWGTTILVALVVGITIQQIVHSSRRRTLRDRTETAVAAMSTARAMLVPHAIDDLKEFRKETVRAELSEQFEVADDSQKLSLAFALAHFGDVRVDFLVSQVKAASPAEIENFIDAMSQSGLEAVAALEAAAELAGANRHFRDKARFALLALRLNAPSLAKGHVPLAPRPYRANFVHRGVLDMARRFFPSSLSFCPAATTLPFVRQ